MSARHFEELWREGVAELVALLDAEHPEDRAAAPRKLGDWARLYVRYVQTFRKLCAAHDGLAHPQKRAALRRTLDACLGRTLELRAWLAQLNGGVDVIDLGEHLAALQLTPEALDLPVPSYFREARAEAVAARAAAAAEAAAAAQQQQQGEQAAGGGEAAAGTTPAAAAAATEPGEPGEAEGAPASGAASEASDGEEEAAEQEAEPAEGTQTPPTAGSPTAAAAQEQQAAGDGQTAAAEEPAAAAPAAEPPAVSRWQQLAEQDPEQRQRFAAAAVTVQAGVRGWLGRRAAVAERRRELEFLGMAPPSDQYRSAALAQQVEAIGARRKQLQGERQAELEGALLSTKAAIKQREGWAMKEGMRDKLNDWFLRSRDPESGEYPDLPDAAKGGSHHIIHPQPPEPSPEEAAAAAKAKAASAGKASSSSSSGAKGSSPGGKGKGGEVPRMTPAFLEGLREAVQEFVDVWQEHEERDPTLALLPPELQGLPQPKSNAESYDAEMVTAEVRPVVHEELRLEVDEEMRRLIQSIKETLKAGREGRKKKGGKKGAKGDGKKDGKKAAGGKDGKGKDGKGKGGDKKGEAEGEEQPAKKKKKDLTAGRSIESVFAELATAGLVRRPPTARLADFLGSERLAGAEVDLLSVPDLTAGAAAAPTKARTGGKKANAPPAPAGKAPAGKASPGGKGKPGGKKGEAEEAPAAYPEQSLAQARQAVAAACVLPLGAHDVLAKLQAPTAVLLYGPPGSGKSLLAQAATAEAGANLFDLSPAATDGKYGGKAAASMVNMVFKCARALAPSVVLVEDAERVFITDKTRARAFVGKDGELANRIRKQLLAEVADLEPGDGVLVLCTSRQPQACVKKDERALRTFVQRYIQLPLPDYGGRHALLCHFAQQEGLDLSSCLSLLSQLSIGLSAGQLLEFVRQLAAASRAPAAGAAAGSSGGTGEEGAPLVAQDGQKGAAAGHELAERSGKQGREKGPVPPSLEELALQLLPTFAPFGKEEAQALGEWSARVHLPLPPEEEGKDAKKGAKKN